MQNTKSTFSHIHAAKTLSELMAFEYIEFLYCAYRTLLCRSPDEVGMGYYFDRLKNGEKKIQILMELRASAEGRRLHQNVEGLEAGIRHHKIMRQFDIRRLWSAKMKKDDYLIPKDVSNLHTLHSKIEHSNSQDVPSRIIKIPISSDSYIKSVSCEDTPISQRVIWLDITTSMEWKGAVTDTCLREIEIAHGLNVIENALRFCIYVGNGFVEIEKEQLSWLLTSKNASFAYSVFLDQENSISVSTEKNGKSNAAEINLSVKVPQNTNLFYPFHSNDILLCFAKLASHKEGTISKIKSVLPELYVGNIVYESKKLSPSAAFYFSKKEREQFISHARSISNISDFIIYGSTTAQREFIEMQRKMGWKSPPHNVVKPGVVIGSSGTVLNNCNTLDTRLHEKPYILAIGNFESRDNFDTIYKAFKISLHNQASNHPILVLYGELGSSAKDLLDSLNRDPIIKDQIVLVSNNLGELKTLLDNCLFVVAPSPFENSIATIQKSFAIDKFCIVADTPEARDCGGSLACYVSPLDSKAWATKLEFYSKDTIELRRCEARIKSEWKKFSWTDATVQLSNTVRQLTENKLSVDTDPEIWLDISTSYLYWEGGVAGIIRAELTFAKYLFELAPNTSKIHFFAWSNNHFFEIIPDRLQWLFDSEDLVRDYKWFQEFWKNHTVKRDPFAEAPPTKDDPRVLYSFPNNSIVLFTCIDWNMYQSRVKAAVEIRNSGNNILLSQLIYDMTPFLVPHLHAEATCAGFIPFVEFVSNNFDHLIYGGKTAMRDTLRIQKENKWRSPASDYIEFGSDIQFDKGLNIDDSVLVKFDIINKFILTVGTIEPRKNHEMLYKAYLLMIALGKGHEMPTLVIVGKRGWKFDDFLDAFEIDDRIKGKIIMISPSDMELDVLYRKCSFTVLPSFYEGWSLTLPESLGYGKFCLTSKVDPLIETGGDLVEYIDPLDTAAWAERIHFYACNLAALKAKEAAIAANWKPKSWKESTQSLCDLAKAAHQKITTANVAKS